MRETACQTSRTDASCAFPSIVTSTSKMASDVRRKPDDGLRRRMRDSRPPRRLSQWSRNGWKKKQCRAARPDYLLQMVGWSTWLLSDLMRRRCQAVSNKALLASGFHYWQSDINRRQARWWHQIRGVCMEAWILHRLEWADFLVYSGSGYLGESYASVLSWPSRIGQRQDQYPL